ncbi:MAG: hypothetical protein U0V87_00820 [Acidobacteriota bacterium]
MTTAAPHGVGGDPIHTTSSCFTMDQGQQHDVDADIQTAGGFHNFVPGISLGSGNSFTIGESQLSPNQTNFIRLRAASPEITALSQPIGAIYDPSITSSSQNLVRALSVSRSGTDVLMEMGDGSIDDQEVPRLLPPFGWQCYLSAAPQGLNCQYALHAGGISRWRSCAATSTSRWCSLTCR